MALDLLVRRATPDDLAHLLAIEKHCFPDTNWTGKDFLRYDCTVAESAGQIAGFVVSRETFQGSSDEPPEREILNLAVIASFRRTGVATLLLQRERQRAADLFLEVRESNWAARNLYQKLGFKEISRRTSYYQDPEESGIVMRMK